jgi:hypothetical protein
VCAGLQIRFVYVAGNSKQKFRPWNGDRKFLLNTEFNTETREHFPPKLQVLPKRRRGLEKEARIFSNNEGQAMKKETVFSSETDSFSWRRGLVPSRSERLWRRQIFFLNGSTALVCPRLFFSFLIYSQSAGLLERVISSSQGLYLCLDGKWPIISLRGPLGAWGSLTCSKFTTRVKQLKVPPGGLVPWIFPSLTIRWSPPGLNPRHSSLHVINVDKC